jgi:drug/metabolite transporter (DMT)-like permease
MQIQNTPTHSNPGRGYGIALASAAILSTTGILIRYLTQTFQLPPLLLALWRDGFVFLTLFAVLGILFPRFLRINGKQCLFLIGYGFTLSVFNSLWTVSVALNGAAIATVLGYCSAGFTAILGWWFLKESLSWVKLVAIIACLTGCVLASDALHVQAWQANFLGILSGLLSGLTYAFYSILGRSAAQRNLNPWTTLLYTFGFAAGFLLLYNLFPIVTARQAVYLVPQISAVGWSLLFLLAAGPTLLGFGLYNVSLSYLPSSIANLMVTSEPVFTAIIAYFLLGEHLNLTQMVGSLIILSGVATIRIFEGRKSPVVRYDMTA